MTTELKPCPFCGGEAKLWADIDTTWIMCSECLATSDVVGDDASEAVRLWNRRADCPTCAAFQSEIAEIDKALERPLVHPDLVTAVRDLVQSEREWREKAQKETSPLPQTGF